MISAVRGSMSTVYISTPGALLLQVAAAGGLDDFEATSAYIGGAPSENGVDGSIRYLALLHRALSDAEMVSLSSTFSGTGAVCGSVAIGAACRDPARATHALPLLKVCMMHGTGRIPHGWVGEIAHAGNMQVMSGSTC